MKKFLLITAALLLGSKAFAGDCIPGGDERAVNAALAGPNAKAILCPRAIFNITHSIVLSATGQQLETQGRPVDDSRAVIRVVADDLATAIFSRATNIEIRNVIVDGARPKLGRLAKGGALIEVGGDISDLVVDQVLAYDPRGWSALHVAEGTLKCSGAKITNNTIGPAGTPDHEWADGISFACGNGRVVNNTVLDASDGGIVLFGAPGTIVENNVIKTTHNILLGGINLVDYKPYNGDYSGTVVRQNRIIAQGGFIKVAIAAGPAVWGSNKGDVVHGASIIDNLIQGDDIAYGIAIDGVENFTVTGNKVESHPHGIAGATCIKGQSIPGKRLIRNPSTTRGTFQNDFEYGPLRYSICAES